MLLGYLCSHLALKNRSQVTSQFLWMCVGGGEGVSRAAWDEVVWLPGCRQLSSPCAVGGHKRASEMAFACAAHRDICHCDWTEGVTCIGGALPPLLLWSSFSPNSLDSQQFWVQAGHWAADVSKAGQDRASWSPYSPRGVAQAPPHQGWWPGHPTWPWNAGRSHRCRCRLLNVFALVHPQVVFV